MLFFLCECRHPFVLGFVDAAETEESILLVTEYGVPLDTWCSHVVAGSSEEQRLALTTEIVWGFRCVVQALKFLHANCSLLHGNMGFQAIFVTPNGDWKLGSLELACNIAVADDVDYFTKHHNILSKQFCSPERLSMSAGGDSSVVLKVKSPEPPGFIDIFGLGQIMQTTFDAVGLPVPAQLTKYVSAMVSADMKKRPSAAKVTECPLFHSDQMKLVESLDQLAFKTAAELSVAIAKLEPLVGDISVSICSYKIMPSLTKTLQIAVNDFNTNRDAREACRQVWFLYRTKHG
jgi:hypothetical protein